MTERPVTHHEPADEPAQRPATRHEPAEPGKAATRHESAEPGKVRTRHEAADDGAGKAATRHEPADGVVRPASRRRFFLPPAVERDYEWQRDLSSGGAQADVVLCTDRATGEDVAIKIYRPEATEALKEDAIRPLTGADPDHVLRFRLDRDDYQVWEVQEFFPLGSLDDLTVRRGGGAQPADFVRDVLNEVGRALDHIHAIGISHRDLKPQNILIRSEQPLDCVLADFGLARMTVMSNAIGSVAGTYTYTSPEGSVGRGNKANDWWGLGVIVHELLTGRHLHASPGGEGMLSEIRVRAAFFELAWSYDEVTDPRWRLLLDGLLAPAEGRWSWPEVREWLDGGSPAVTASWPSRSPSAAAPTSQRRRRAYHFAGRQCHEPVELAQAIRENFTVARDLLAGVRVVDLKNWLHDTAIGTTADDLLASVRAGLSTPGRAAVELQLLLDPDHEPGFRGRDLSSAALTRTLREAAAGDVAAAEWIRELRGASVLSVVGHHAEEPRLSRADELLVTWWRPLDTGLLSVPPWNAKELAGYVADARKVLEGALLDAALNEEVRQRIWDRARDLLSKVPRTAQPSVASLRDTLPATIDLERFSQAVLTTLVFPQWLDRLAEAEKEAARAAAAAREEQRKQAVAANHALRAQQAEQLRREQGVVAGRRKAADFTAIWVGVIACVTVLAPWLAGRYVLRGDWPRLDSSEVFDVDARKAGAYFLSDWIAGCLMVAVLVAAFILLRPWRQRIGMILVAALGLSAAWYWGAPYVQQEWNKQEHLTAVRLKSTPYPFDEKYYTCGSATRTIQRTNAAGYVETNAYSLFTARAKGSSSDACNLIEFYDGWRRMKTITLQPAQYVTSDAFSSPVTVTSNTLLANTTFTVETRSKKKLTYKLSTLLH